MSYLDVALRNIAGRMPANFRDNNMRVSDPTPRKTGLRILATGTASSGIKDSLFEVNTPSVAASEFGADSELVRIMDQVLAQNATADLQLMRVGSFPGHVIVSRAIATGSKEQEILIRISPRVSVEANAALGQQSTFDSLKVIFAPFTENGVVRQRVLLFNANDSTPVFDSENKIVADGSSVFDLELNVPVGNIIVSAELVSSNSLTPTIQTLSDRLSWDVSTLGKTLTGLAATDLKVVSTITSRVDASFRDLVVSKYTPEAKNKSLTPSQRYYANELAYQFIDTIRPDMIYCEGCTADTPSVEIDDLASDTQKQIWQQSHLGKMWKADFEGKPYSFFFSRSNPFDTTHVASTINRQVTVAAGVTANCAFSYTAEQKAIGDLHALVDVHVEVKDAVAASVEWFPTLKGEVEVHVVATAGSLNAGLAISTPFFSGTITGASLTDSKQFSVRPLPLKVNNTLTYSAIGTQNFVLTPWDLAQEPVPEAVLGRLFSFSEEGANPLVLTLEAANTEVREVSFLHQSAFNAYRASTNYSQ